MVSFEKPKLTFSFSLSVEIKI